MKTRLEVYSEEEFRLEWEDASLQSIRLMVREGAWRDA